MYSTTWFCILNISAIFYPYPVVFFLHIMLLCIVFFTILCNIVSITPLFRTILCDIIDVLLQSMYPSVFFTIITIHEIMRYLLHVHAQFFLCM